MYVFQIRGFFRLETSLDMINSYLAPRLGRKKHTNKQIKKSASGSGMKYERLHVWIEIRLMIDLLTRPFPNCPKPQLQSEAKCETIDIKKFSCNILMQIELIFTRKVLHLAPRFESESLRTRKSSILRPYWSKRISIMGCPKRYGCIYFHKTRSFQSLFHKGLQWERG